MKFLENERILGTQKNPEITQAYMFMAQLF